MAEKNCVYVDTNLGTHLLVLVHDHETISDFKEKLCKEHHQCFPKLGEIHISAVKAKRQKTLGLLLDYHLPDSMFLSMAFDGLSHNCWFVSVDADKNCLNLEKEDKEIATLLDGNQNPEEDLESERAEKTTKKREVELSDVEKSHELSENVQVDIVATPESSSPKDEALTGKGRDKIETVSHTANHLDTEKKNISKDDVNQSSAAANVDATPESLPTSKGENLDVPFAAEAIQKDIDMGRDQTDTGNLGSHTENHLDTKSEWTARPDTEKKGSKSNDDINQPSTTNVDYVDDSFESLPDPREENHFAESSQKDPVDATPESLPISRGSPFVAESTQKGNFADVGRDYIETSSGSRRDTEKKKRRKKSSKDDTNQSFADTTASGGIVNEKNGVPGNEDPVGGGATLEILGISSAEASQKEETEEKIDEIVGGEPSAGEPCNVEIDGDEAESMKPMKKRKSQKSKTPAEEDTASDVEPDNVIGNGKKSSRKAKKKHSSQVLSVEVNSTKDTETDASLLKKFSEEKGDNFGCSQNQIQNQEKPDQVVGGVKSKNDKTGLHIHPKERISSRVQQSACSGTYRLRSRVKSVRSESMSSQSQDDDSPVDCVPDSESL